MAAKVKKGTRTVAGQAQAQVGVQAQAQAQVQVQVTDDLDVSEACETPAHEGLATPEEGAEVESGPRPALLPRPATIERAEDALGREAFYWPHGLVAGWFIRRSDVLLVTFDNLGSIGEHEPPQPWLQGRAAKAGVSILGVMATQRDWYRNEDAQALIRALAAVGFFAGFRRVVLVGASMGGFAALSLASLVEGAVVLAFSPQTTLAQDLVPFETRYRYARRRWDWKRLPLRDAAEATATAAEIYVIYDPFVSEDRRHVARLEGAHVVRLRAPLLGHRAIRQLKTLGMLQALIVDVAEGQFDQHAFAVQLRKRRDELVWRRALIARAEAQGHDRLALLASRRMAVLYPDNVFGRRSERRLARKLAEGAAQRPLDAPERRPSAPEPEVFAPPALPMSALEDQMLCVSPPRPTAPFTGKVSLLHGAYVVPERDFDSDMASGVLDRHKAFVGLSKAWIRAHRASARPSLHDHEPIRDLAGTHVFAGHFRGHFGHFLVESTARLWALGYLDQLRVLPESLLYLPYRGDAAATRTAMMGHREFFGLLGLELPLQISDTTLRVERLIVPELGFGWNAHYAGSPAYRAFMQGRLAGAVEAEGGADLYVSRARLNAQRGGILGETVIEENLARLGWQIFHPEKHTLAVQLARYKAARRILALDGSALHLAAYVMPRAGRLGMILRRSSANHADYTRQFEAFCDITPDIINVIRTDWVAGEATRVDFRSIGEVDFEALFERLKTLGYVPQDFQAELPSAAETRAMLGAYEDKRGAPFRALSRGERHGDEM